MQFIWWSIGPVSIQNKGTVAFTTRISEKYAPTRRVQLEGYMYDDYSMFTIDKVTRIEELSCKTCGHTTHLITLQIAL